MAIDHFTREQFEAALPKASSTSLVPVWYPGDWAFYLPGCSYPKESSFVTDGEFMYSIPVKTYPRDLPYLSRTVYIAIRSSVDPNGQSAEAGEDSIRLWLMSPGGPVAGKLTKYITRVKGWEKRMITQLRTLYKIGLSLKPCPTCGELMHAFTAGKGKDSMAKPENVGRLFQKCCRVDARGKGQHGCERSFEWIEFKEDKSDGK
jgi:hypothetical protein